jgi:2-polyprenyl-3-methyl-5-hydroxy-6-metoxy-1,4-benzoquinol methylase
MDTCIACKKSAFETLIASKDYCVSREDFTVTKCTNCGFAFTANAPDAQHIGKYYEQADYISHTDTKEGLFFKVYHKVRTYMLGQKLAYIKAHNLIKSLLDIGSGTGYFVNHVKHLKIEVLGFEPDAAARAQAKKNFDLDLESSLEEVRQSKKTFDAISMWHVLEHVHELDVYFEHFRSLLNDKGLLVIAVPNYTSYDASFYKKYWAAYDLPKHLWHFSPQSVKLLAANHQFKHVQSYAMPFDPFYIALLSEGHKKSGIFGKIRALCVGGISFFKGLVSSEKASSVVYIFSKN